MTQNQFKMTIAQRINYLVANTQCTVKDALQYILQTERAKNGGSIDGDNGQGVYNLAKYIANNYVLPTLFDWDDLPDVNSLHDAEGINIEHFMSSIEDLCTERLRAITD